MRRPRGALTLLVLLCLCKRTAPAKISKKKTVLFVSIPWLGHANPLRRLGKGLLSKGYKVDLRK